VAWLTQCRTRAMIVRMASVDVSASGPSDVAVRARLEAIARETGLSLNPINARASFVTAGGLAGPFEVIHSFHGPSLTEAQVRTALGPYEDAQADPNAGVRVVVL
jgi:hypothetical protein